MSRYDENAVLANHWDIWKKAKEFPSLYAKSDYTIVFTLGLTDFGWSVGSKSKTYSGTPINLTGHTIKLYASKLASAPNIIEGVRGYGWIAEGRLFDVSATVVTAASGICSVALTPTNLDGYGAYIAEIEVTETATGKKRVPGQLRLTLIGSVSDR